MKNNIARVLINLSLNKYFDYKIPETLLDEVKIGSHVTVPFGKSRREGCVVAIIESTSYLKEIKEIERVSDKKPIIPQNLIELGEWMASYYCCSKEQAMRALLPGSVRSGKISRKKVTFLYIEDSQKASEFLFNKGRKYPAQEKIVQFILQHPDVSIGTLKVRTSCSDSSIKSLEKAGIIKREMRNVLRDPFGDSELVMSEPPELTDEQAVAVREITNMLDKKSRFFTALLFGVTGSGKTEVYLRAINEALNLDKDSIVLVPEIALTPQTTERFRARFGNQVSVLHSSLSDGERFDEWTKIYEGKVKIVVGARSALFAPFKKLGLIIVDEEHENSYKQDEAPRYNARDVAVMRSYREGAVTILGSATPSLESFYNAKHGKYELIKLTKRIDDRLMPSVSVIDMRAEKAGKGNTIFSRDLISAVYDRLNKKEQTIIFLNRRGFATHLTCHACGYTANCKNCSVDYTYHRSKDYLACHICGDIIEATQNCPQCKAQNIKYSGVGTEKIEDIATKLFPLAKISRMDSDTMTNRKSYEDILLNFRRGKIDILIGTQMLAKGLDFPNVTLVGIVNADLSLHIPDFRAAERTFQLLTQVAGRAGRGVIPGEVFIQTYTPFHEAIKYAVNHDYEAFYNYEIPTRDELSYPPKTHLAVIRFSGEEEDKVSIVAEEFIEKLSIIRNEHLIFSPVSPSPISKIKNKFRYSVMLRGNLSYKQKTFIKSLIFNEFKNKKVNIIVDIDALNLM